MQSAYAFASSDKAGQEKKPLALSGDFFYKIIVENSYRELKPDEDGIFRVGIIPFLLDSSILDGIIHEAKSSPRTMFPA